MTAPETQAVIAEHKRQRGVAVPIQTQADRVALLAKPRPWDDAEALEMRRAGDTLSRIALRFGISTQWVQRKLEDARERERSPKPAPVERPCARCRGPFVITPARRMLCDRCFRGANE